jgi:hypothetical protein
MIATNAKLAALKTQRKHMRNCEKDINWQPLTVPAVDRELA